MGVETLWLSPVTPSATGDFGYDPIGDLRPRSDYGTEREFRETVDGIHARGMRLLID